MEMKVDETRETIKHGDEFDIMDIKGPIPVHGGCVNFDLFCGAYKGSVYGIFSDMPYYSRHEAISENISLDRIDGTGKVVVSMMLYPHATVARVEVMLNDSVAANVYGVISAINDQLVNPSASSVLFLKESEEKRKIILGTEGLIPLSRSRVAVPVGSMLFLDFSLVVEGGLSYHPYPFQGFCELCFKILSPQEVQQMSLDGDFGNSALPNQGCSYFDSGNV
ncbi:hypothetical protein POM88_054256 [Heracleum sosnowskyi]|uniref:DUF6598 domain-containing protein n=1 Tax=Heracleum sosnowskyi TaxID=360622 RepID=A0AAD8GNZ0_9APIA|nr:hypothetical protein POM88_054256 [Heracleum sosnowskyi]